MAERVGSNCVRVPEPSCPFEFPPQHKTAAEEEAQVWIAPAVMPVNVYPPNTALGTKIMVLKASFDPIWPNPLLLQQSNKIQNTQKRVELKGHIQISPPPTKNRPVRSQSAGVCSTSGQRRSGVGATQCDRNWHVGRATAASSLPESREAVAAPTPHSSKLDRARVRTARVGKGDSVVHV